MLLNMKKLAVAVVASLFLATPVIACPHSEGTTTAEKKKDEPKKEQPKQDEKQPETAKAKENKEAPKKTPDKVSQK